MTSGWGCRGALMALVVVPVLGGCGSSSSSAPRVAPTPSSDQSSSVGGGAMATETSSIRQLLRSDVAAHVFPGAVVVVRRGGQVSTVAVGRADTATALPMTAADRFQIASLTKSMVAATALELVARGRLSLADTVEKWEPGLLPRGADITVADLLGQTSGLPDFTPIVTAHYVSGRTPTVPSALVGLVSRKPLMFPPGSRSYYSNTNYVVLGMILQRVGHEPLATLLQQRVFGPLGMHSASLAANRTSSPPLAHGYDHGHDATNRELSWIWAAGGVVASAGDVATFYDALLSGKLVPRPLLHRMLRMRKETNPELPFSGYGLGIASAPTACGPAYGHSGKILGFTTDDWTTPDGTRSVALAVNANLTTAVGEQVGDVITEALCGP